MLLLPSMVQAQLITSGSGSGSVTSISTTVQDLVITSPTTTPVLAPKAVNAIGNLGATPTVNWNSGAVQSGTLNANATFTLSNPLNGQWYFLSLTQDATGSRTVTWPASVLWPGGTTLTVNPTAGSVTNVALWYDGTNYQPWMFGGLLTGTGFTSTSTAGFTMTVNVIAAPGTPAASTAACYVDSTSKNWACKGDAGVVNHGIQTRAATASQWIRAIADDGTTTISQPAFSDISGTATAAQGGTGQTVYVIGDLLSANTTTTLSRIADVATGQVLTSGGVGVLPAWSANPSVATITLSPPANTVAETVTGYSITGASTAGMLNYTGTLNTTGIVDGVWRLQVTDTAHGGANSTLLWAIYGGAAGTTQLASINPEGTITLAKNIAVGATGTVTAATRWTLGTSAGVDGVLTLLDSTGTSWVRTNFGGNTTAFPALARSGTTLTATLADGTAGATFASQSFNSTGVAFASLGTPVNGTFIFCSDCTIANPCAAAGTGALAKRLNAVWVCN